MITAIVMLLIDKVVISEKEDAQRFQAYILFSSICLAIAQDIALIRWLWS